MTDKYYCERARGRYPWAWGIVIVLVAAAVCVPGVPAQVGNPLPRQAHPAPLTKADFKYLGSYVLGNDVAQGLTFGMGLTHRYVDGQLRFLTFAYDGKNYNLVEFALPSSYATPITKRTNFWPGPSVWKQQTIGRHMGLTWEDLGKGAGRLWTVDGIDYPGAGYLQMTEAVSVRQLNADGTMSAVRGYWGFQGVSQRCVMGRVIKAPAWFTAKYGLPPYLYGLGGYASLMAQGGTVSLGLFLLAGPDVTTYKPTRAYPPPGYRDDGKDWTIPASAFKVLADHRSGTTSRDWYARYPSIPFDRGIRLNAVANYFDGGDPRQNPSTPPSKPPTPGAQWLSPAPDGKNRWVWADTYSAAGDWIDGPNKSGLVAVFSGRAGKAYYMSSALHSDNAAAEIHCFDPADLGAAALGKKRPWMVQPSSILDITRELQAHGVSSATGATFDPITSCLYVRSGMVNGGYNSLLSVWKVNP